MATLREPEKKEDKKDEDEKEETEQQAPDWDIKTPGEMCVRVCLSVCASVCMCACVCVCVWNFVGKVCCDIGEVFGL